MFQTSVRVILSNKMVIKGTVNKWNYRLPESLQVSSK